MPADTPRMTTFDDLERIVLLDALTLYEPTDDRLRRARKRAIEKLSPQKGKVK